jgi:hypothetical protein
VNQYSASFLGKVVELDESKRRCTIQLLRNGEWNHPKAPNKKLVVNDKLQEELLTNFKSGVRGVELPTNMNHDDPNCTLSPSWIKDMFRNEKGLHAVVEFTDDQLEKDVKDGKVKYFSPEISFGYTNPENGKTCNVLKAAAWTNVPFIKGMDPARFVNLSEIAEEDVELKEAINQEESDDEPDRDATVDSLLNSVFSEFNEMCENDSEKSWINDYQKKQIFEVLSNLKKASHLTAATTYANLQSLVTSLFSMMSSVQPEAKTVGLKYNAQLQHGLVKLLELRLAVKPKDVDLAEGDDEDEDPLSPKAASKDDSLDAADKDAENKNLPMQCRSCSRLQDGTCPFQGVTVKLAAAGDGNCPQYISNQTELSPSQEGSGDRLTQTNEVKMSEKPIEQQPAAPQNVDLAEQNLKLTELISKYEADAVKRDETNALLQKQIELSEAARLAVETEKKFIAREALINKYRMGDKPIITAHQANICLSMLVLGDGGTDVKLSDGTTEATTETLLSELLDSLEAQTPGGQAASANEGGKPGEEKPAVVEKNTNLSEVGQLYPKMEERAKEMSKQNMKPWQANMSEASREITAEAAAAKRGEQ